MEAYPNNAPITIQPTIPASQTIIQVNQVTGTPMMPRGPPREWTTDVCACCDDMTICLCTIFVPCYPCMLAADMNESCCVPMCIPNAGISMRAVVRSRHNISVSYLLSCKLFLLKLFPRYTGNFLVEPTTAPIPDTILHFHTAHTLHSLRKHSSQGPGLSARTC
eukprot:XP_011680390.1 PREDICTED: uncharacterized protein LOC105445931 [Strongylocentrotus purpuratus]